MFGSFAALGSQLHWKKTLTANQNPKMCRVPYVKHRQRAEGIAVNTHVWGRNGGTQHNGESNLLLLPFPEEPHGHSS